MEQRTTEPEEKPWDGLFGFEKNNYVKTCQVLRSRFKNKRTLLRQLGGHGAQINKLREQLERDLRAQKLMYGARMFWLEDREIRDRLEREDGEKRCQNFLNLAHGVLRKIGLLGVDELDQLSAPDKAGRRSFLQTVSELGRVVVRADAKCGPLECYAIENAHVIDAACDTLMRQHMREGVAGLQARVLAMKERLEKDMPEFRFDSWCNLVHRKALACEEILQHLQREHQMSERYQASFAAAVKFDSNVDVLKKIGLAVEVIAGLDHHKTSLFKVRPSGVVPSFIKVRGGAPEALCVGVGGRVLRENFAHNKVGIFSERGPGDDRCTT